MKTLADEGFFQIMHKRYSYSMKTNQKGFAHIALTLVLIMVVVIGGIGYYVATKNKKVNNFQTTNSELTNTTSSSSCPDPVLQSPVVITKVTSVLYPGQTRGGHYKTHGGFRLDNSSNDAVEVKAPMEAKLVAGSRYIEQNEHQFLLDFKSECGVNFRLDHLLELSPKIQALVDKLPAPKQDDSRTTNFDNQISVKAGEVIATAVGFPQTHNVSFDFGVYDTRQPNAASKDTAYMVAHPDLENNEQLKYAVCWFDYLPKADADVLKALPAADQNAGKSSDYCKG